MDVLFIWIANERRPESSAGLQNLLSICDKYCAGYSITIKVKKSVCMCFKSSANKDCDYANIYLSGNHIDFLQEVKYLGVLLNSSMKTSIDISRQTPTFYAQANMLLRNLSFCDKEVKCMLFYIILHQYVLLPFMV